MKNFMRFTCVVAVTAVLSSACRSDAVDGLYLPACTAFAGDSLLLAGGRYTWDKFTDEVKVDSQGYPLDQFPEYPMNGSYAISKDALSYQIESGTAPPYQQFVVQEDKLYLLSAADADTWRKSGEIPRCALQRQPISEN